MSSDAEGTDLGATRKASIILILAPDNSCCTFTEIKIFTTWIADIKIKLVKGPSQTENLLACSLIY